MANSSLAPILLICAFLALARPAHAFGAGNIASISSIEGINYRHGDIMDVVLTLANAKAFSSGIFGRSKKFSKLDVSRLYFGNWLRDYSQAVDVASVKFVSADAVVLVVWVLGFLSFGYGTGEFEVTKERLGTYRPEEHVDNPKGYADGQDARAYDPRLRGPVDERRELSVDPRTGMKNYIANEDAGIATSSRLCKNLLAQSIEIGRRHKRTNKDEDYFEALRILGTACHALEDFLAHSNYAELALIELGERNVFPHVGASTQLRISGVKHTVWPLTTGSFGSSDFIHSVMGGFTDKMEASEIGELGDIVAECQKKDTSTLKSLLMKLPKGVLGGGKDPAAEADQLQQNATAQQMQQLSIETKDASAFTRQCQQIHGQMLPIFSFHDRIMKAISSAVSKIPILPDLLEKISEQLNIWVFSLIAPFILPVIRQVKKEVEGGASAVIKSSKDAQHIVFNDPYSTDPTHSMLSKDHFSNVLNEPSGRAAMALVGWLVPQVVDAWDDDKIDPRHTAARIVAGTFHHPAQRHMASDAAEGRMIMFSSIENWWKGLKERERSDLRNKLSREGVRNSRHHKDGVHDCGHGGNRPLAMGMPGMSSGGRPQGHAPRPQQLMTPGVGPSGGPASSAGGSDVGSRIKDKLGGGAMGSLVGGLAGSLIGGGSQNSSPAPSQSGHLSPMPPRGRGSPSPRPQHRPSPSAAHHMRRPHHSQKMQRPHPMARPAPGQRPPAQPPRSGQGGGFFGTILGGHGVNPPAPHGGHHIGSERRKKHRAKSNMPFPGY